VNHSLVDALQPFCAMSAVSQVDTYGRTRG
jgi:hypothetical protein